jgi:hypothetical protein
MIFIKLQVPAQIQSLERQLDFSLSDNSSAMPAPKKSIMKRPASAASHIVTADIAAAAMEAAQKPRGVRAALHLVAIRICFVIALIHCDCDTLGL